MTYKEMLFLSSFLSFLSSVVGLLESPGPVNINAGLGK